MRFEVCYVTWDPDMELKRVVVEAGSPTEALALTAHLDGMEESTDDGTTTCRLLLPIGDDVLLDADRVPPAPVETPDPREPAFPVEPDAVEEPEAAAELPTEAAEVGAEPETLEDAAVTTGQVVPALPETRVKAMGGRYVSSATDPELVHEDVEVGEWAWLAGSRATGAGPQLVEVVGRSSERPGADVVVRHAEWPASQAVPCDSLTLTYPAETIVVETPKRRARS